MPQDSDEDSKNPSLAQPKDAQLLQPDKENNSRVSGLAVLGNGLPAVETDLGIHHRGFGGKPTLLGTTTTDKNGKYDCSYKLFPNQVPSNLEVVVVLDRDLPGLCLHVPTR